MEREMLETEMLNWKKVREPRGRGVMVEVKSPPEGQEVWVSQAGPENSEHPLENQQRAPKHEHRDWRLANQPIPFRE